MSGAVKRRYHSPQRAQQALATRQQIVDAAARLFVREGYFGTTIEAIAQHAGVAVPTVYAAFGNKRAILSALVDAAIFGADTPGTPATQRTWYHEFATQQNPETMLLGWGRYLCDVNARLVAIQRVVQSAADSDPAMAELWQRMKDQRFAGQSAMAELLAERHALRPGLTEGAAADILFVLSDANLYDACVLDRGWSQDQVGRWLGESLCALILR